MRHGFIVALATCLTGAGAALAEAPAAPPIVALPTLPVASMPMADDAPVADAPCCPQCDAGCCCGPRVWGSAEYLLWWIKDAPVPTPLVTAGPTVEANGGGGAGVIGGLGTTTLLGGGNVGFGPFSGGRFTLGAWLSDDQRFGVEGNYLFLAQQSTSQSVSSSGLPGSTDLGLPFNHAGGIPFSPAGAGSNDSLILSSAGLGIAGSAMLSLSSQLQGAECNMLVGLTDPCRPFQLHLIAGGRWVNLSEKLELDLSETRVIFNPLTATGTDTFGANNNFYGGQVGARADYTWDRFSIQVAARAAFGDMTENVRINASTTSDFFPPGTLAPGVGGAFALPSNIGSVTRNHFAVVPEGDVKLCYRVTDHVSVSAGYSLLYLSDVVRPGNQIDFTINPNQTTPINGGIASALAPSAAAPHSTDFWAQGVTFGLEFKF